MAPYVYKGSIDCEIDFDTRKLRGKTAVVTGGANGLGESYVRALQSVGCAVVIGDLDAIKGKKLGKELANTKFVRSDTTSWEDQTALFHEAANYAKDGKISYVIANAGVARGDDVFSYSGK